MPKYGIIKDGELKTSENLLQGYKLIKYEKIPDDFNQETHYVIQCDAVDEGDYIFIGIEIHELELEDEEFDEDVL